MSDCEVFTFREIPAVDDWPYGWTCTCGEIADGYPSDEAAAADGRDHKAEHEPLAIEGPT